MLGLASLLKTAPGFRDPTTSLPSIFCSMLLTSFQQICQPHVHAAYLLIFHIQNMFYRFSSGVWTAHCHVHETN